MVEREREGLTQREEKGLLKEICLKG